MPYLNLVLGVIILILSIGLLTRNSKRSGFIDTLVRFDTIAGIVAGFYLTISSIVFLLS